MKLKVRMLVIILSLILVILGGLLTYTGINNNNYALNSATALASASGEKIAVNVEASLKTGMDAARTVAGSLQGMKSANLANRSAVNGILKQVLADNPSFLGVWTVWEPNAFDGADARYKNTEGTDSSGRLIPGWSRSGSDILLNPSIGYEDEATGDYYLLAKKTGEETILDPYFYKVGDKEVLMTSVVVPIKQDGKVLGVAGVDLGLEQLQTMMQKFKLYETGYASIYSNDGSIVTSPQADQLGKKYKEQHQDENTDAISQAITTGSQYISHSHGIYQLFTPAKIGASKTPWSIGVTIPMSEITKESTNMLYSTIAAGVVALLLLAGVVYLAANAIVKPITASVKIGELMAQGDFTTQIPKEYATRKDEIGTLARVFQSITDSMKNMIGQVGQNASQVAAASEQISASSEQLASGSSTQARSAQAMSELFKELSDAVNSVARSAEEASELSKHTSNLAVDGGKVVRHSIDGMNHVSRQMSHLEEDSSKIGEIIEVIDDIAEQTNLLALNAAIEAARAGDQGRGFAVVADEVRKLAERSGEATKQITVIIKGMQENTRESVKAVNDGVNSTRKTGEAFENIIAMVNESADKVTEIAAASEEQAAQANEVNASIENISAATQQAAASCEETASSAQSLAELADQLNRTIARFKIN